jgi:hypothetical protein
MRKLIGYLVARNGAEDAAARMAAGIFLTNNNLTGSVRAGSPITIIYSRENFADGAIGETVAANPGLGVSDCGSRAGRAASEGARRA